MDHAIELVLGTEPFASKIYPLNLDEQKHDEFLEQNLWYGRIRSSKSPTASPFFFIKKKDGSLRLVWDFLPKAECKDSQNCYLLPLISEVVHKLRHASIFTKLNI